MQVERHATMNDEAPIRPWEAAHPGKRAVERAWLLYTPVWAAVAGAVMLGGFAEAWGDVELMIFGVVLAAGAMVGPHWLAPESERAKPFIERVSTKMVLSVVAFSFFLNYSQTPFFYDVLHMHYGFDTQLNIRNNPFFLYLVTVAYFSTYCILLNGLFGSSSASSRTIQPRCAGWGSRQCLSRSLRSKRP